MTASTSLRDYQRTLSARLVNPDAARSASKLGVQVGASRWLINLADTAEVIPAPMPAPVPLTRDWFLGVTSVRGNLYGVVDFRGFTEGMSAKPTEHSRLLLLADKYRIYSGLLVDRVLGLYRDDQLRPADGVDASPWAAARFVDEQSQSWLHLGIDRLVTHSDFLQVGA
jgi:twitching motility protein PilI